jgi:multisubunit Na+/H+ antiporter MnhE subunit
MAIVGKIVTLKNESINIRPGEVVADIIMDKQYLQIRTYAMGDIDRERGSKQNIQITKEKAIELKEILEIFIQKP